MVFEVKKYVVMTTFGAGSFVFASLVSIYTYNRVQDIMPHLFSSLLFTGISIFLGLSLILIYAERSMRPIWTAALVTAGQLGALLIAHGATPYGDMKLFQLLGMRYIWWASLPVVGFFLNPTLVIFNGLQSIFFGLLIFVFRQIRKKDIFLVIGFFFLILTISAGIRSALMLWDIEGEILRNGIFGALLSLLIRPFFVVDSQRSECSGKSSQEA